MKKLLIVFIALYITGCEKISDDVLESTNADYQVTAIFAPDNVVYSNTDSSFVTSLKITNPSNISEIWFDIYSPAGTKVNPDRISLLDNGILEIGDTVAGDNIYSRKYFLKKSNISGKYRIEYLLNYSGASRIVATHNFNYYNGQANYPPVISNLNMPDTVIFGQNFIFNIKVFDANGLDDVKQVIFTLYRPDGTTNGNKYYLIDDGKGADEKVDDGIYSYATSIPSGVQQGAWTFHFQASDRSDSLSNIITHKLYVK